MIIKSIEIEKFRAFENVSFELGKKLTAISGRNATQKTTVLGMLGQPFTISSKEHPMYGCKTIDGYNFRSQFKEKFKISPVHDVIGDHKWKLVFRKPIDDKDYFSIASIPRRQNGKEPSLRFWNSESRASGAGYVQLPVYYLSLSRLFPIGESGKTKSVTPELTEEELQYCIDNYRTILSIQNLHGTASLGLEKGSASKTFTGISDEVHDIFTNSAGEGNIVKIILAILSFKRLQEVFERDYKGGILLIDELDATLYEFSQEKLVEYLYRASEDYKIQIIFTTHSHKILKAVGKIQRREFKRKGDTFPPSSYDAAIVYLKPDYIQGNRVIIPQNIMSSSELNDSLNDISLSVPTTRSRINVYCEDDRAVSFVRFILKESLSINLDLYMNFVDINLGWTNYLQLYSKDVPEFKNNIILLDGDVPTKTDYKNWRKSVETSKNIMILPIMVEQDLFTWLKSIEVFTKFTENNTVNTSFSYDICFNNWPLEPEKYNSNDYKDWLKQAEKALGGTDCLFKYWYDNHREKVDAFVEEFVEKFNSLAEILEYEVLPPLPEVEESENI